MNEFNIKITTLTPVCIGDGQKLNARTDYIADGGKIHYLDKNLIADKLADNEKLMDIYINGIIYGMDNNKTSFDLKNFLEKFLNLAQKDYSLYSVRGSKTEKELSTIIKNADGKPYIPASTLKGAIKTALLYDWLKPEKGTNPWAKNYLNNLDNRNKIKKLEKELENKMMSFEMLLHDSSSLDFQENCRVIDIKRIYINIGKLDFLQSWESITENTVCKTKIKTKISWEELCKKVNRFSLHQNQTEQELLENERFRDNAGVKDLLLDFYEGMNARLENNSKIMLMRIGSGKGYYFNSVGLALYEADESDDKDLFFKLLKRDYKKVYDPNNFPHTRVIDVSENQPLGWVKLEKI